MRKISRTRPRSKDGAPVWSDRPEGPPPGIRGATVTSKPVDFTLDLSSLRQAASPGSAGASPGGAGSPGPAKKQDKKTVSLSDGTRITFVTAE
jgi:hypothetical protein